MRDALLVFGGRSHPALTDAICRELGVTPGKADIVQFSNENIMVQVQENVREADVFVVQTSSPPVHEHFMELLIFVDALKRASARRVTAVLPYFPYVRSDKKDRPRISITARLMADLLEASGVDRVLTMDLHAPQIQGFFRIPVDQLLGGPFLTERMMTYLGDTSPVVVAADVGEAKDAARVAKRLHLDLAIIDKRRHGDDECAVAERIIGDVEGRAALLIDDEVASGGTLAKAAVLLRRHGATHVMAAATHGVLSGNAPETLAHAPLDRLLVTDTVPLAAPERFPKVEQVSVAALFASAIERIHHGMSISALFEGR